jgi:hypothetical protein
MPLALFEKSAERIFARPKPLLAKPGRRLALPCHALPCLAMPCRQRQRQRQNRGRREPYAITLCM